MYLFRHCFVLKMWIVLIVVLPLFVTSVKAVYHIQDFQEGTTWQKANHSCNLTAPDLKYKPDGIVTNLNARDFQIKEGESVWLGYVQAYQVFQYVGCARDSDLPFLKRKVPADPALCYSACGSDFFGLMYKPNEHISECYCFIDNTLANGTGQMYASEWCKQGCENPIGAACGGKHSGTNYVSLYKHVAEPRLQDNDPDAQCLGYERTQKKYIWYRCATIYRSMCEKGSDVNIMDYADWLGSTVICFDDGQYPMTYRTPLVLDGGTGSQLWTGMIRSGVVFKHNDTPITILKFAYMELVEGIFQVGFTANTSALIKKALCYRDEEDTTLPSTPSSSSIGPTVKPSTTITNTMVTSTFALPDNTDSDTTQTHDSTTDASSGLPLQSSDNESNTGVYVGVSVAIIVLLALAVLGFVIWRRRQRAPNQNGEKIGMTGRSTAAGGRYADSDPEIIVHTEQPVDNQSHDFDKEDTYDTTDTNSKGVTIHDTENIYNKLNIQTDDTYNHTQTDLNEQKPTASSSISDDNTYDTSGNFPNKIGNRKATHATDETYSHVKSDGKKQTDNVYAKAILVRSDRNVDKVGHVEAETTYDSADHTVNTSGVPLNDDTYSHVNMKQSHGETNVYDTTAPSKGFQRTENVYGKIKK